MVADRGTREAPVYSPVLGEIVFSVLFNERVDLKLCDILRPSLQANHLKDNQNGCSDELVSSFFKW